MLTILPLSGFASSSKGIISGVLGGAMGVDFSTAYTWLKYLVIAALALSLLVYVIFRPHK